MRNPAVDLNLSPLRAQRAHRAQGPSVLSRLHWPRIIGFTMALSLWPAIIYTVSRFV